MKKHIICLFITLAATIMNSVIVAQNTYHNPVIDESLPDPTVMKAPDGYFYLFATEDDHNVPIYRSHNLVDWIKVGKAFTDSTRPTWLDDGAVWAPDINYIGGKYVMYYSLSKWGEGKKNGIGVAVAERPEGPYTDNGKLFTSEEIGVDNSIDPFYIEDNESKYLFWGSFNGISYIKLSDDGLSLADGAKATQIINKTVEASSIIKHGSYYYYIGSQGSCCEGANSTYSLVVARASTLTGSYTNKTGLPVKSTVLNYKLTTLLQGDKTNVIGPGHCSEIVEDNEGKTWLLHHGYKADDPDGGRVVYLEEVKWDSDGWPYIEGGVPATTATAPALTACHEISNAQELVDYANLVNSGNGHVEAVLTADIDMNGITTFPGIGNDGSNYKRFHSTFDGQGHRIKNLHMNGDCVALFPVVSDNTIIRNLIIDSSCSFTGTGRNAALVSASNWPEWGSNTLEILNCGNEAEVSGTGANCAALLGCNYNNNLAVIIRNCYNTGHIQGAKESAALCGWLGGSNNNNRVDHCYNIAEVEGLDGGNTNNLFRGHVGQWSGNNNCYDTHYSYNTGSVLEQSKVASGELCWLMNQNQQVQWYQTLGTDSHPIPVAISQIIYRNGDFTCGGESKGSYTFSNTDQATYDSHTFGSDGVCKVCGQGAEPVLVDGVHQIASIGNMLWLAHQVNVLSQTSLSAALVCDIEQGNAQYTPIGNTDNPFVGTFDGHGHCVTLNLDSNADYQGVFGVITDGVHILNLLVKGKIIGNNYVGGIVGGTNGGSNNQKQTWLQNCGNEAAITARGKNAGGLIGVNMGGSASFLLQDCFNAGTITGNESGALSGWSGGGWSRFENCYNAGMVNESNTADFTRNNGTNLSNCYYLEGCNNGSGLTSVSASQLTDGTLLAALNQGRTQWNQFTADPYPYPFIRLLRGDVNIDGSVDINDVTRLVDIILGRSDRTETADVHYDKNIDINDVTQLVNIILNKLFFN